MGDALASNHSLRELGLARCALGGQGTADVLQGLTANPHLNMSVLDLSGNGVGGGPGLVAITEALTVSKVPLRVLGWADNSLASSMAEAVGRALRHNWMLTRLDLGGNFLRAAGAYDLISSLGPNT